MKMSDPRLQPYRDAIERRETEWLIKEIEVAQCVPITQMRAHWTPLAQRVIAQLRRLEAQIADLTRADPHTPPPASQTTD